MMSIRLTEKLHPEDMADLQRSGLSAETIASMGCYSESAEEIGERTGVTHVSSSGYCIPYFGMYDQTGAPYGRRRLSSPSNKMRYVGGRGDDPQLYIPPAFAALPASNMLVVTEGEKKAAKAVQEGVHCVAVQGTWSWCDAGHRAVERGEGSRASESTPPIATLTYLAQKYRSVLVLGDSDLVTNPQARAGFEVLTKSLLHLGVRAALTYCPPASFPDHGEAKIGKQGLDDWLVADRSLALRSLPALFRAAEINHEGVSDTYNARVFVELVRDQLAFSRGDWRYWNGSIWVTDDCGKRRTMMAQVAETYRTDVDKLARLNRATMAPINTAKEVPQEVASWVSRIESAIKELRDAAKKISNLRGIDSALALAQAPLRVPDDAWDSDPYLLSVRNGVVDLRTAQLSLPDPRQRITRMTGSNYDPNAKADVFLKFIEEVQPAPENRDFLQRLAGYSAIGRAAEQKFFTFVGGGANGKSTYVGIIMDALGDYAVKGPLSVLAQQDPGRPRNDLAMLAGARLVSISETPENMRLDEATVKAVTGQDVISARFLNHEFFQFRPCFTPILDTNHAPRPRDAGEAIWRRLVIVPWSVMIPADERDRNLRERLLEELPGVLSWIIEGAKKYLKEGLPEPPKIIEHTQALRSSCDDLGRWLGSHVEQGAQYTIQSRVLYEAFLRWCEAEGVPILIPQRQFTERLRGEMGFNIAKRHGGVMTWQGLRLRDNVQEDLAARNQADSKLLDAQVGPKDSAPTIPLTALLPGTVQAGEPHHKTSGCVIV